jgi:hypothetical protein
MVLTLRDLVGEVPGGRAFVLLIGIEAVDTGPLDQDLFISVYSLSCPKSLP